MTPFGVCLLHAPRDASCARWLRRKLLAYRVPRSLARTRGGRGEAMPGRIGPVILCGDGPPAADGSLPDAARRALEESGHLVVLCSPHAAASRRVDKAVRRFKAERGEDRLLTVIVDGEPNADLKPDCGLPDCYPEAVKYAVEASGKLSSRRLEPISPDLRPGKDGRSRSVVKLAAGILGVDFEALWNRDLRRRRARRRLVASVLTAMLTAVFFTLAAGWLEREQARRAQRSEGLRLRAEDHLLAGRANEGAAFLAEAVRCDPGHRAVAERLLGLLMDRSWLIPFAVLPHVSEPSPLADTGVARDSSGSRCAVSVGDAVTIWDFPAGAAAVPPRVFTNDLVIGVAISAAGDRLAVALRRDYDVWIYDLEKNVALAGPLPHDSRVMEMFFTPDGRYLVTRNEGTMTPRRLSVWRVSDGERTFCDSRELRSNERWFFSDDDGRIAFQSPWRLTFSAVDEGGRVVPAALPELWVPAYVKSVRRFGEFLVTQDTRALRIWSDRDGEPVKAIDLGGSVGRQATVSPDARSLVAILPGGVVQVWSLATGTVKGGEIRHDGDVSAAAFSADGQRLVTATRSGEVRVWDASTCRPVSERCLVPGSVRKVWFAAGGTIAAVLEDGRVIGWDARLDVVPFVPVGAAGGEFEGVGFAAGGGLVLTVSPSGVTQAWNAATGLPEVPFARHAIETTGRVRVDPIAEPDALASPDSQHEASPDPDDARIVRIRAGRNTRLLRHESDVRRICFSADGRLLATACRDASVHVWSARDGRRVGKALPHSDAVWALVFSRDGRRLAVVSSRGEVHLWDPAQSARLRDPVPVNGLAQMIALDPRDRSLLVAADPRVPARIVPLVPRLPAALSPAAAVRLADAGQEIAGVTVSRDGNPERRQALATRDEVRARIAAALRDAETIRPGEVQDFFQWFSKEPEKRPAWPWQEPPR